jgi:hypothetical protein
MSKDYRTREAPITAVDTRTAMNFLASATAESPANIPVPKGRTKLVGLLVAAGPDYAATGSAAFFIRLEGARRVNAASYVPLDVDVIPGNTIALSGEMVGADIGTAAIGATLIFA